jgi:hypothetical protein
VLCERQIRSTNGESPGRSSKTRNELEDIRGASGPAP